MYRTEDKEVGDAFPGILSDCLYFTVESIEFDLPGTLHVHDCSVFWEVLK